MLYLDESRHHWCFPEMPPVINAGTPEQVFEGLARLHHDPAFARDLVLRGQAWYAKYHFEPGDRRVVLGCVSRGPRRGREEMKAVIVGASGFLGRALSRHLLRAGWDVLGYDLAPP